MDTGWLCRNVVMEQRWHFAMEHIWCNVNVFTWLGLWFKCRLGTQESTRYYMHGQFYHRWNICRMHSDSMELLCFLCFACRTGQRKAINCLCCASRKSMMKMQRIHRVLIYRKMPANRMQTNQPQDQQHQQYLISRLSCTPIPICRIKAMRHRLNRHTHCTPR